MREEGKTCGSLLAKHFTPWAARPLAAAGAGRSHTLTLSQTPTGIDKGYDKDNSRTHALTHSRTPPLPHTHTHTPTRDQLSSRQTSQPSFIENAAIISPNSGRCLRGHAKNAAAIWRLLSMDTAASSAPLAGTELTTRKVCERIKRGSGFLVPSACGGSHRRPEEVVMVEVGTAVVEAVCYECG